MSQNEQIGNGLFDKCIIENMSEGVITFDKTGKMVSINKAAEKILEKKAEDLIGTSFTKCFIDLPNNDNFNQIFLEAIYDPENVKEAFVEYNSGQKTKSIRMLASYLKDNNESSGVILVLSDMTELMDLRDATKAMNKINELNSKLAQRNEILQKTFGRFLSDEIVYNLLEKPDGLAMGGKKVCLSIMMSDLRGFTALSERMDASDLLDMLNHYLGEMTEIIQRRRGTIIEFIGDGIMAVFGAPNHFEGHAGEALAAAVEMQHAMTEINEWNNEHGYPSLQMGIGLNLGDVIVGNIGSEKRTKYGITGKEVNVCGRIESFTVGGEILAAQSIIENCGAEVEIAESREVIPKGAKTAMTVYKITGIGEPYNVSCGFFLDEMKALTSPIEAVFYKVQEKNILAEDNSAQIIKISSDLCILQTETVLDIYDNIELSLKGSLYGKVISKEGNEYTIRFTSTPKDFELFVKSL